MFDHQNSSENTSEKQIEEEIIDIEASLAKIKQRYEQIQADQQRKDELLHRQTEIKEELATNKTDSLKSELNLLKDELAEIELRLESELFKLSEPFWQAVRFLGIGIVIGWILHRYV